ncbi:MAG: general secretion pathway protein GspK [bacterium]|nr:general secretion pathway protein GspK [bacterium]
MKDGFILVITLGFLAILAANAFILTEFINYRMELQHNQTSRFLVEKLSRAGITAAEAILLMDNNTYDWFSDIWVKPKHIDFPEGSVDITIEPLDARFNINSILNRDKSFNTQAATIFSNLLSVMGFPSSLLDALLDWFDSDEFPRVFGAESDYYGSLHPPYKPSNGPLNDIYELAYIKGFTPEILMHNDENNGLLDLLTTFSDNKINVNMADPIILQALGYSSESVEKILNERELRPLNMNILMQIDRQTTSTLTRVIKFTSSYFRITSKAQSNGVLYNQSLIVQRANNKIARLRWEKN